MIKMNKKSKMALTRLKHCEAVRINNELYTVKYGESGDYLLYKVYGRFELI